MELNLKEMFIIRDALDEQIYKYVSVERFIKAHETAQLRDKVQTAIDEKIDPA